MLVVLIIIHHILAAQPMEVETLTSFLEGADQSEFPLENIPFGIVSSKQHPELKFSATRIGTTLVIKAPGWLTSKK
jgi:hypothetical protein